MRLKNTFAASLLCLGATAAFAQPGGSNSSYSRFGVGTLCDASSSFNRSMGGAGVALRAGNRVNAINPASYSACDSLSLILDVGMSFSMGSYSTSTLRQNVKNTSLDNVNAMFRIRRGLGMSVGFVPYSSIGYNYSISRHVGYTDLTEKEITNNMVYEGSGGLHNIYAGIGWEPFKGFSIGANVDYVWGAWTHSVQQTYSEGGTASTVYDGLQTYYDAEPKTYKIDAGLQYDWAISKANHFTVGATVGVGHKISGGATIMRTTTNGDTISSTLPEAFDLPWSVGVGVAWTKTNKWMVAADYRTERWGDCRVPQIADGGKGSAVLAEAVKGGLKHRHFLAAGLEYIPDYHNRNYMQRIRYRLGANFSTPYYTVGGADGPTEFCLGVGFGLPITNQINNRSTVNVGFQWAHVHPGPQCSITENYFKINVGITFNEAWFLKWKIR